MKKSISSKYFSERFIEISDFHHMDINFNIISKISQGDIFIDLNEIKSIDEFKFLNQIITFLQEFNNSDNNLTALTQISQILSKKAELEWSIKDSKDKRHLSFKRISFISEQNLLQEDSSKLNICVKDKERNQLRYNFIPNKSDQVFVHFVMKTNFESVPEVFAAVRWIHGNDPEEVVIRFKNNGLVIGQGIFLNTSFSHNYNLISIGRYKNKDIIAINGIPVFFKESNTEFPTGIVLDLIGNSDFPSSVDITLFIVDQTIDNQPFFQEQDYKALFMFLIAYFSAHKDLKNLNRLLYSFSGLEVEFPLAILEAALDTNLEHKTGYCDYITDALIERISQKERSLFIKKLSDIEPTPIVYVENVSVQTSSDPSKHASISTIIGKKSSNNITLLDNISFRAYEGDIVGIIGKNGAGKSTFLKTLIAAMPLTKGCISINDKPILLRPGAGMQGDLTGRQNIMKTGLYMGYLPHEIHTITQEIIDFSELKEHIDRPFRYYSDGMRARLIFSLATAIPCNILLLDELLSAGDMGFQKKAMNRLNTFIKQAKIVFVVQHTFDFVLSRCTKCLFLELGKPIYFGNPEIAIELYKERL